MDCDFSHDPNGVAALIAAAEDGADVVLGSRYVPGGRVENWGLIRRFISTGRLAVRDAVPADAACATPPVVSSASAGSVLETIPLDRVDARGYAFQIEMTYRAKRAGFRVVEEPITFADRTAGHSKMSRTIVLEAIWRVPLLRFGS